MPDTTKEHAPELNTYEKADRRPYRMNWPEDGKLLPIEDLAQALRGAFAYHYIMRRRPVSALGYYWKGPPLAEEFLANGPSPHVQLTTERLEASKEQGRDALAELILLALRLGMTQGVKWERARQRPHDLLRKAARLMVEGFEGPSGEKDFVLKFLDGLDVG